jgi:hypothetical protein
MSLIKKCPPGFSPFFQFQDGGGQQRVINLYHVVSIDQMDQYNSKFVISDGTEYFIPKELTQVVTEIIDNDYNLGSLHT